MAGGHHRTLEQSTALNPKAISGGGGARASSPGSASLLCSGCCFTSIGGQQEAYLMLVRKAWWEYRGFLFLLRMICLQIFFFFFLKILFIYERHREREKERHRQREKQPSSREPDVGLHARVLESCPKPKADAQPLSHPGVHAFKFSDTSLERELL